MVDQNSRIPCLDGLRAVSILLVIISHATPTIFNPLPSWIDHYWLSGMGGLGVRVFFVISGYLITSLLFHELERDGTIRLTRFYFRRFLRIFVPYYVFILVILLFNNLQWTNVTSSDILHALTYTVNYYPQRAWDIGHAWSLSVEEQFYLIWPAVVLLAGKRRGLLIALAFFLLAPMIRLGYFYLFPTLIRYEVGYRFETVADAIAIGCLLAGLLKWFQSKAWFNKILHSNALIVLPFILFYITGMNPHYKKFLVVGITLENLSIALIIAWCVTCYQGRIGRFLNSKILVFIGVMSYSIYLWQQIFLNQQSDWFATKFPVNILFVCIASLASYYWVEKPSLRFRQWIENMLFRTKGPVSKVLNITD